MQSFSSNITNCGIEILDTCLLSIRRWHRQYMHSLLSVCPWFDNVANLWFTSYRKYEAASGNAKYLISHIYIKYAVKACLLFLCSVAPGLREKTTETLWRSSLFSDPGMKRMHCLLDAMQNEKMRLATSTARRGWSDGFFKCTCTHQETGKNIVLLQRWCALALALSFLQCLWSFLFHSFVVLIFVFPSSLVLWLSHL